MNKQTFSHKKILNFMLKTLMTALIRARHFGAGFDPVPVHGGIGARVRQKEGTKLRCTHQKYGGS